MTVQFIAMQSASTLRASISTQLQFLGRTRSSLVGQLQAEALKGHVSWPIGPVLCHCALLSSSCFLQLHAPDMLHMSSTACQRTNDENRLIALLRV